MKEIIISLAVNGRDNYQEYQKGLIDTLDVAGDCHRWIVNTYPYSITPHNVIPYKFKYDLILSAQKSGYEKIWWLDSTMRLLKNPFELFDKAEKGVVAFHNVGHETYQYITDKAVKNLGCESYLKEIKNTWGGCIGFDFAKDVVKNILTDIIYQSIIGTFDDGGSDREGFIAARHDQSCNSVIFHNYGIKLFDYGVIASKNDVTDLTYIQYGD